MSKAGYSASALAAYAGQLLRAAGLEERHATVVAGVLVEGDLMGHDTHGLALLPGYMAALEAGTMEKTGAPHVVSDRPAALLWDGRRLPGPSLVMQGIETLAPRARDYGNATLVIRRSHHIACLAAYLRHATDAGLVILLTSSDPSVRSVAPFGGTRALFTPNPIALGIPTSSSPIMIDISASVTTNAMTKRLHDQGERFDEPWMLDAAGHATNEPGVLFTDPPGTIMPLGGLGAGHKGFGLSVMVEALTGGLAGFGRADPGEGWGATVSITLYDPEAFGGMAAFQRQMDWLADACRANPPRVPGQPVRMPGDRAIARRLAQLADGVHLQDAIHAPLEACGSRYGIPFPEVCHA
ncbi:dehydrogenase [Caballeronia sordidicola]|uniref:Dehydrogenase n=1 Tax=Caballeronia sordidicola TaxID=196367 RepID=A0A158HW09_CABSO|nr:Ldh family oxidoreductase [Caballeronia sordidicola]SAL48542.1 dehydrogenase [Caballeronia sordidicola]